MVEFSQIQPYVIPLALLGFIVWRFLRFYSVKKQLPNLLSQGAVVIDVRSAGEYLSGAREGSINIPLGEIESRADKLDRLKPVILCCASGTRSAMAAVLLKRKGFKKVVNAGPWRNTVL